MIEENQAEEGEEAPPTVESESSSEPQEAAGETSPEDDSSLPEELEAPEDLIESLQGVQAVRSLLGDEVEEITSFTDASSSEITSSSSSEN